MSKELASAAEARRHFYAGRLSLFDHIAHGFFRAVASGRKSGLSAVLNYLDGALMIDGALYTRRTVVLAVEDLEQHIEAPLTLQSEAHAQMSPLKLSPIPELMLYGDIATAILRMDSALRTKAPVTDVRHRIAPSLKDGRAIGMHQRLRVAKEGIRNPQVRVTSIEENMGALELWHARQSAIIEPKPSDVIPFKVRA